MRALFSNNKTEEKQPCHCVWLNPRLRLFLAYCGSTGSLNVAKGCMRAWQRYMNSELIFLIHKTVKYQQQPLTQTTLKRRTKTNGKNALLPRTQKTPKNNDESLQKRNQNPQPWTSIHPNRRPDHGPQKPLNSLPKNPRKNNPLAKIKPKNRSLNP